MNLRRIVVFTGALLLPWWAVSGDWKQIARETDEPAFGTRIDLVTPASQAERLGLQEGDFLLQIDEQRLRSFGIKRRGDRQALFYVPRGGRAKRVTVTSGKIGVYLSEVFHPWIAWLRGEIGTPGADWEEGVTEVLMKLHEQPALARQQWEEVRAAGYPADEMDAFIRSYLAWRLGEPVPAREAYDKIYEEFEVFPALYYAKLEDLAFASNQTEVLRKLHELDPDSSTVSERYFEVWDKLKVRDTAPRNLLELAIERRVDDLSKNLPLPVDVSETARPFAEVIEQKPIRPDPGKYRLYMFQVPSGVRDFHCSFSALVHCHGHSDRWSSLVRFTLSAHPREEWEGFPSSRMARIGIGDHKIRGPYISVEGGMGSGIRQWDAPELYLPVTLDNGDVIRPVREGEEPHRLDIVKIGEEAAVYCNGICYLHLPVSGEIDSMNIALHVSGIECLPRGFQFWSLLPEQGGSRR